VFLELLFYFEQFAFCLLTECKCCFPFNSTYIEIISWRYGGHHLWTSMGYIADYSGQVFIPVENGIPLYNHPNGCRCIWACFFWHVL